MSAFEKPVPILRGFKDNLSAITAQGDRLYVGTSAGAIHVYELGGLDVSPSASVQVKQGVTRRAIDQLGFVKDANSLVVLSTADASVTLLPLPTMSPPTVLGKAKGAMSFGIHTSVQRLDDNDGSGVGNDGKTKIEPVSMSIITRLVIGCKRRVVVYTWVNGEPQEPKEAPLQHSPRAVAFFGPNMACFAYPANDYGLLNILSMTATDIVFPTQTATSVVGMSGRGMGALTGLFSAKAKPMAVSVSDKEVLIIREGRAVYIGSDGKQTRPESVEWPTVPEDIGYVKPYVFSAFPPNSVPSAPRDDTNISTAPATLAAPVVQVMSSLYPGEVQTLPYPFADDSAASERSPPPTVDNYTIRFLAPITGATSSMLLVSSPNDKTAAMEGSTVWSFRMKSWADQIDGLVQARAYNDALALLDSVDTALLPDKLDRRTLIRKLQAVTQFRAGHFDIAIDTFIELDVTPAKVVALFPPAVSGHLATAPEKWIQLYGGPLAPLPESPLVSALPEPVQDPIAGEQQAGQATVPEKTVASPRNASPIGTIRETLKSGIEAVLPVALKDDDNASIRSRKRTQTKDQISRQSIETLMRYLSDRRPQVGGALDTHLITPAQASKFPPLSIVPTDDLFALPDLPFRSLAPGQLVMVAQVLYTALFKSYLVARPGLLSALCRVPNWCEVSMVEEELSAREKYDELISLYSVKKMHAKALNLLQQRCERDTDDDERLQPMVRYLQRLGPEHIDLLFQSARWVISQDRDAGFEIFTSEEVELPRDKVADFMESIDLPITCRYLRYLIDERAEVSPYFHDRLAESYLHMVLKTKLGERGPVHSTLLDYIRTDEYYHVDRLFGLLPSDDLFEARAILLGKLGRHEHALELYVYRLKDYFKAEQYCNTVYQAGSPTGEIYLSLLRIYLQPRQQTNDDFLKPALELVSRHGPRLDPVETLNLVPPMVTAKDLRPFLMDALRAPIFDTRVVGEISKARKEEMALQLMLLQSRRVKIDDSRTCPQCHKRLGTSVIAVHAPRGEVTHYQCREQFSEKLHSRNSLRTR